MREVSATAGQPPWPAAAVLVAAVVILAGCAVAPAAPMASVDPNASSDAPRPPLLADYARRVQSFDPSTLANEHRRLAGASSPTDVLQRALLMAAPRNPARDDAAAAALARAVERSDAAPAVREAGAWVALWIDEQARAPAKQDRSGYQALEAERRLELMEQRLRETERRLAEADRRGLDAERRALTAERKLEALRLIERELSGRPADQRR